MGTAVCTKLKDMYFGRVASERKKEIFRSLRSGRPMPMLYLITFCENGSDQLEILPSYVLLQETVRRRLPLIAGAALGKNEAVEVVAQIASDARRKTGGCRLQEFLLQQSEAEELR